MGSLPIGNTGKRRVLKGDDGLGLGSQSRHFLILRVDCSLVFGRSFITSSLPVWVIRNVVSAACV